MKKQSIAILGVLFGSVLSPIGGSVALACKTCVLGIGTPTTFVGGMVVSGVGANPLHDGVSVPTSVGPASTNNVTVGNVNSNLLLGTTGSLAISDSSPFSGAYVSSSKSAPSAFTNGSNNSPVWANGRGGESISTGTSPGWNTLGSSSLASEYSNTGVGNGAGVSLAPEPVSLSIVCLGLVGVICRRRK